VRCCCPHADGRRQREAVQGMRAKGWQVISPELSFECAPAYSGKEKLPDMNEGLAYHEAGHAVVGHVLGFFIETASIIESEGYGGEVTFADEPPDPDADEHRYLAYRERELGFTLGGPVAQGHYLEGDAAFTPADYAYGDDWDIITDCVRDLAGEDLDEGEWVLQEATTRAYQILTQNWTHVEAVAKALMKHGLLDRPQLLPLFPLL
jgi:ATP-dependent Zn protease